MLLASTPGYDKVRQVVRNPAGIFAVGDDLYSVESDAFTGIQREGSSSISFGIIILDEGVQSNNMSDLPPNTKMCVLVARALL